LPYARVNLGNFGNRASFASKIKGLAVPRPLGTAWELWEPQGGILLPDQEQVKLIFKDTYLFYTRWVNTLTLSNAGQLMQDVRRLNEKYDCELCRQLLLNLVECIEEDFLNKQGGITSG
jgi:hypothetical protein